MVVDGMVILVAVMSWLGMGDVGVEDGPVLAEIVLVLGAVEKDDVTSTAADVVAVVVAVPPPSDGVRFVFNRCSNNNAAKDASDVDRADGGSFCNCSKVDNDGEEASICADVEVVVVIFVVLLIVATCCNRAVSPNCESTMVVTHDCA
jgi:hypothetical protein